MMQSLARPDFHQPTNQQTMHDALKITINVAKIDESAIFDGKKGRYASFIIWPNRDGESEYGDIATVRQDLGVERKDEKPPIIGNAKLLKKKSTAPAPAPPPRQPAAKSLRDEINDADEIPF